MTWVYFLKNCSSNKVKQTIGIRAMWRSLEVMGRTVDPESAKQLSQSLRKACEPHSREMIPGHDAELVDDLLPYFKKPLFCPLIIHTCRYGKRVNTLK